MIVSRRRASCQSCSGTSMSSGVLTLLKAAPSACEIRVARSDQSASQPARSSAREHPKRTHGPWVALLRARRMLALTVSEPPRELHLQLHHRVVLCAEAASAWRSEASGIECHVQSLSEILHGVHEPKSARSQMPAASDASSPLNPRDTLPRSTRIDRHSSARDSPACSGAVLSPRKMQM